MKMFILYSLIIFYNLISVQSALYNNPCITIVNSKKTNDLLIEDDPNWDDQVLYVNNVYYEEGYRAFLRPNESVEICSVYPQQFPGGSFGIMIAHKYEIIVRNIVLETNEPTEKMVIDDNTGALQLVDATFLTAKLFITDAQDPSESLKFLKWSSFKII